MKRILTVLAGLAAILMYVFNTGTPAHMAWSILALGFFSSAIYTTIITLGSQQTKVPSPKLVKLCPDLRNHRYYVDLCGYRPDC